MNIGLLFFMNTLIRYQHLMGPGSSGLFDLYQITALGEFPIQIDAMLVYAGLHFSALLHEYPPMHIDDPDQGRTLVRCLPMDGYMIFGRIWKRPEVCFGLCIFL